MTKIIIKTTVFLNLNIFSLVNKQLPTKKPAQGAYNVTFFDLHLKIRTRKNSFRLHKCLSKPTFHFSENVGIDFRSKK